MATPAAVLDPVFSFYQKFAKMKADRKQASNMKLGKQTRDKLGELLKIYNVDLTKSFGVADFSEGQKKLGSGEVSALEHISAAFMAIAGFVRQVGMEGQGNDFEALLAAGIPQLIAYQYSQGKMCHNKVAKEISEMLSSIG